MDSDWSSKKREACPRQSLRPSQVPSADHCRKFLMKQLGATTTTGNNTMVTSSNGNEQQQSAAVVFGELSVPNNNSAAPMATTPDNATDAGPSPLLIIRSPTNSFIASMPIKQPINGPFTCQGPLLRSLSRMRPGAIPINISAERKSQADGEVCTLATSSSNSNLIHLVVKMTPLQRLRLGKHNYNMQQGNAVYFNLYIYCFYIWISLCTDMIISLDMHN